VPEDFRKLHLRPGESVLVPSGVRAQIPEGYMLTAFNKSGISTKNGLVVGAQVCDEDYEGEIHLHLFNVSDKGTMIEPGMKLTQFILVPVLYENIEVVDELPARNTERGTGAFGSTGTH
jgi:dUTP pyrophosphatase